jgi:hypothetical protein
MSPCESLLFAVANKVKRTWRVALLMSDFDPTQTARLCTAIAKRAVENCNWLSTLERVDSNSGVLLNERTCNGKEHNLPLVR